uniref:Olfactory receptor 1-like n=1 Tax=Mastacembelus armatus TaxID=205130 RepID=A0A3Q3MXK5_9TELE
MSTASTISNVTFMKPEKFYLSGFYNVPRVEYIYIFLCFVYIMTVVGNVLLLSVIFLVKTLHTPKYMIVFNLALTDLCGSTALIPKVLDTFLFGNRYIVYEGCLCQVFFVMFFGSVQSWTLVTMAYDRFIAICFPLRYHSIVTKPAVAVMLLFAWAVLLSLISCMVGLLDRLSFCGSLVIQSFFCDHGALYQLPCNDKSINRNIVFLYVTIVFLFPLILIALTYVCIAIALTLKTCTSHLILVAIFYFPLLGTSATVLTSSLHPNARMVNSTLTHVIPALLNPIIYSLNKAQALWLTIIRRASCTSWNTASL